MTVNCKRKIIGLKLIITVLTVSILFFTIKDRASAQGIQLIRIGLAEGIKNAVIGSSNSNNGIKITDLNSQLSFELNSGQTAVFVPNGNLIDFNGVCQQPGPFIITLQEENSNSFLSYQGKLYRGKLEVSLDKNGSLIVVNELPIEDYLCGVLPQEMLAWFPEEALKAQAVASRTYTYSNLNKHKNNNYNLCATTHCQVYGGAGVEDSRTNNAVYSTRGEVLTYNGTLISAFYHASSGGHTENSENVWSAALPYLKGVVDYDQAFP
ncbi:MAG TPA: SpoIID/LytB domain-containing protein, partial [Clostridia bacterium]|nr:SpoIID/LytB domain-containing protein [Clostridia bacterium]